MTGADVCSALANTLDAARVVGREDSVRAQVRALVEADASGFMAKVIGGEVGLT